MSHSEIKALIKAITGRDVITAFMNHINGIIYITFEGVMLLVSNDTPGELFGTDKPMWDRFIPIQMAPREGERNIHLFDELMAEYESIVGWALSMPKEHLATFARANSEGTEEYANSMIDDEFVNSNLEISPGHETIVDDAPKAV